MMHSADSNEPPVWVRHASLGLLIAVLFGTLITAGILLLGAADPRPVGELIVEDDLNNIEGWRVDPPTADAAITSGMNLSTPAGETVYVISPYNLHLPGTIELSAALIDGAPITFYGFWWAGPDSITSTVIYLNTNGYFAVEESDGEFLTPIVEMHRFPWVHRDGEANRMRVTFFEDGSAELRINDEVAALFPWHDELIQLGFYVKADVTLAEVSFDVLRLWSAGP